MDKNNEEQHLVQSTPWSQQFLGREQELQVLIDSWKKAKNGNPQIVTLLADSGFGKTRIIQAFYNWLSQNEDGIDPDGYWPDYLDIKAKDLEIKPQIPDRVNPNEIPWLWWALRWHDTDRNRIPITLGTYLKDLLLHTAPIQQWRQARNLKLQAFKSAGSALLSLFPGMSAVEAVSELWEQWGLWKESRKVRQQSELGLKAIEQQEKSSNSELCLDYLNSILNREKEDSRTFPVVIVLDDAQWMDDQTLELLNKLLPRAINLNWPLLIIASHWEAEWHRHLLALYTGATGVETPRSFAKLLRDLQHNGILQDWSPNLLTKLEVEYLKNLTQTALPGINGKHINSIVEKVDGNPLYLVDVIRYLEQRTRNFDHRDTQKALSTRGEARLAEIVQKDHDELIVARFNDLSEDMQILLGQASYQGMRFIDELTIEIALKLEEFEKEEDAKGPLRESAYPETITSEVERAVFEFRQRGFYQVARDFFESEDVDSYQQAMVDVILKWYKDDRFKSFSNADKLNIYTLVKDNDHLLKKEQYDQLVSIYLEIGDIYSDQLDYSSAEESYRKARAIAEQHFSPDHPILAKCSNRLATNLETLGKSKEALPIYQYVLSICEKAYGSEHIDVAISLGRQARTLRGLGKAEEALPLIQRSLTICESVYGLDNPEVATRLGNLATILSALDKAEEALPLHQRCLAIYESVYGPDHPYVATNLENQAAALESLGKMEEALPLIQRSLEICESVYGPDHSYVAKKNEYLAHKLRAQDKTDEALPLYKRSLAIKEAAHGPDHPDIVQSLIYLALALEAVGNIEDALPLIQRCLTIRETLYEPKHTKIIKTQNKLAQLQFKLKHYSLAKAVYLALLEKCDEKSTEFTYLSLWLGRTYYALMLYDEGLKYLQNAYECYQKYTSSERKDLTNWFLGVNFLELDQYEVAKGVLEEELQITQLKNGAQSADYGLVLSELARALFCLGDESLARDHFSSSVEIIEQAESESHRFMGVSLYHYASAEARAGRIATAIEKLEQSITILDCAVGDNDHNTIRARNLLNKLS